MTVRLSRGFGSLQYPTHAAASLASAVRIWPRTFTMYCLRPSDSKLTQMSGAAPARRHKSTNSAVPTWFDSMPPQRRFSIEGRLSPRPHALTPAVEVRKNSTPPHHRRGEPTRDRHDILAPVVAEVIPGGFD